MRIVFTVWIASFGCGPGVASYTPPPPNILVVLLDDVGLDGVAAYGLTPDAPSTPTLDALADEGVLFTHAYTYPLCTPSRAALLTGRYGRRFGVGANIPFNTSTNELPQEEVTLAEMVAQSQRRPYHSGVYGKWHLAGRTVPDVALNPTLQGFDHAVTTVANLQSAIFPEDAPSHDYHHWEEMEDGEIRHVDGYNPSVTIDAALGGIERLGEPWLAYVALHSAHGPMHVPPEELHTTQIGKHSPAPDLFRAVVEAADHEIDRLLRGLDPVVLNRTVVIVMGDNGTSPPNSPPSWEVKGGKGSIFDGGIRTPLIIYAPGVSPAGAVHHGLVHIVDLFPTIAELVGVDPHRVVDADGAVVPIDGRSLVPVLTDPSSPGVRDVLYTEHFGGPTDTGWMPDKRVVTDGRYKLVDYPNVRSQIFSRVGPSPEDEGDNRLLDLPLSIEEWDAYARLTAEYEAIFAGLATPPPSR